MLHILNGSSLEYTLKKSPVPGEFFSFRDALISGPALSDVDDQEWRRLRALHLSESYGVQPGKCEQDLLEQTAVLQSSSQHDEVVLWFEHDLFCQLNLLYLLDWFSKITLENTKLSLINIGNFPNKENFRGLGELNEKELASLFPQRQPISSTQIALGSRAWKAFCSTEPTAVEDVLQGDTLALPFLSTALKAHLRRFPNTKNGLGKIENTSLAIVEHGKEKFADLFSEFVSTESVYGMGDTQVWLTLVNLCNADEPLLTTEINGADVTPEVVAKTVFKITDTGRAVMNGDVDFIKLNGIDQWFGGVHVKGSNSVWRWDELSERLQYR